MSERSENLFYAGCVASYRNHDMLERTAGILKAADFPFMMLGEEEICCGDPFLMMGMREEFNDVAKKNVEAFRAHGIKRVVAVCPMCVKAFKVDYQSIVDFDFEVLHITELFSRFLNEKKIKFTEKVEAKAFYHDPCHLGRHLEIYNAPRRVLREIPGLELVPIPGYSRELSWCCGGPLRVSFLDLASKLTDTIVEKASDAGCDTLISACPTCNYSLWVSGPMSGLRVYDITEVVSVAMGLTKLGAGGLE